MIICCTNKTTKKNETIIVSNINNVVIDSSKTKYKMENYIGNFLIPSLIDSGLVIKPYDYIVETIIERRFRNYSIPIKVCAKYNKNGFGSIDSLKFNFENKIHRINIYHYTTLSPLDLVKLKNTPDYRISFVDYNFDNYPDIVIYNSESGNNNYVEDKYIYDKNKQKFIYNKTLSEGANFSTDSINKIIHSFWGYGIGNYSSNTYKWKDDELLVTETESQYLIDSLHLFVKRVNKLVDGKWIMKIDTLTNENK
jgi:hypothetical protein